MPETVLVPGNKADMFPDTLSGTLASRWWWENYWVEFKRPGSHPDPARQLASGCEQVT